MAADGFKNAGNEQPEKGKWKGKMGEEESAGLSRGFSRMNPDLHKGRGGRG